MTRLQKVQMRQSELKVKLNAMLDTEIEKRAETYSDDLDKLTKELRAIEGELQAAILADDSTTETQSDDGESKEFDDILRRSAVGDFLSEAAFDKPVEGASAELRQALDLGANTLPLDVLLLDTDDDNDREQRADAVTNHATAIQENQSSIAGRIFAGSAAAYMGVQRPTVPVGDSTYVTLATGTTADVRSDGVEKDADAATFTSVTVSPVRQTARYLFGIESTARLRGMEDALRADLTATMSDKLDKLALQGQAAVANVSPAVTGLVNTLTDPTNPSTVATWTDFLDLYTDRVDGMYSQDGGNVRVLVNPATFKAAYKLQIATSGELLRDRLPSGRFRASANMPASTNANIAKVLAFAAGRRGFVQPVWRGVTLIRDPYSNAAKGQIALTVVMLTGAVMVDSKPYHLAEVKTA